MLAPTLTRAEQRAALRKAKKKRILKNVLGLPKHLKVESVLTTDSEVQKLRSILERLLPSARLPAQGNLNGTPEETALKEAAQIKRKQLSLGVNSLNKSIKNGLISAVLLASDIEPKFLVHHLNLLCSHNKIPHLHMVGLREITKNCLGFPCIALGFKSNSDFSEAINKIRTISSDLKNSENSEKTDEDMINDERIAEEAHEKNDETPVTYLYRSSIKERIFIPESEGVSNRTDGFIPVEKDADAGVLTTSFHHVREKSKKKLKAKDKFSSSSLEGDFEVPRKKQKKHQGVGSAEDKQEFKYHSVNLMKVSSNPNRVGKKRKF